MQEKETERAEQLRQELENLLRHQNNLIEAIGKIDNKFKFTQQVEPIPFEQIKALVGENTAIIEWYVTQEKFFTFIITPETKTPIVRESSTEDLKNLEELISNYRKAYYSDNKSDREELFNKLNHYFRHIAQILHLDEILASYLPKGCQELVLIPHHFLHLVPLHGLPLADGSCLLDRFPKGVRYAPSCQLLQLSQTQQHHEFANLFAIQEPTNSQDKLAYTKVEVEAIRSLFPAAEVLAGDKATKEATSSALSSRNSFNYVHFSCHGGFNPDFPLESALLLAEDKNLTLGEIFELNLNQCRLVSLSACETGLTDIGSLSDEYISLPSGFLYAGSPSVVSSLWTVDDLSTAFLMIKFYENLQNQMSVAVALNQAQCWLRDVTKKELKTWIAQNQLTLEPTLRISLNRKLQKMLDDAQPFQSPYYWAAFCAIGQ